MSNTRRIGFRSDTRSPDEIFREGFVSRKPERPIKYSGNDIKRKTAVCFTWRLAACPYFPILSNEKNTWIYVLNVDLTPASNDNIFFSRIKFLKKLGKEVSNESSSTFVNTHGAQCLDTVFSKEEEAAAITGLFADEIAVKEIKTENILFAVECIRQFEDILNHPEKGGTYKLVGPILDNPNFKAGNLSPNMIREARKLIDTEIQLSAAKDLAVPLYTSGFQKNSMFGKSKKSASTRKVLFHEIQPGGACHIRVRNS